MGSGASVYPKEGYAPLQLTLKAFEVFKDWLFLHRRAYLRRLWRELLLAKKLALLRRQIRHALGVYWMGKLSGVGSDSD